LACANVLAQALVLLAVTTAPALAADAPQKGPSELIFVAQIVALLLIGRLLGEAMLRLKQPAVMGQLIAGLMLGPSLLGALFPDFQHALFPAAKEQKAMLDALSQFGILMLLLMTGMETDLKLVRQTGRAAISASLSGIIVPFACGVALGELLPDSMLPDPGKRLITSLFLGTALSIASVKIVATIIREMNFMRRTVGQVILASAIIDDTVGWMITAVIFSLALQGQVDAFSLAKSVLGTIAGDDSVLVITKDPAGGDYLISRRADIMFVLQHPEIFSNEGLWANLPNIAPPSHAARPTSWAARRRRRFSASSSTHRRSSMERSRRGKKSTAGAISTASGSSCTSS